MLVAFDVQQNRGMDENIVLMPGADRDHQTLFAVAADFGWPVEVITDLSVIVAAQAQRKTAAIFFCHEALGPGYSRLETVRVISTALPHVRLVFCHGFSETIDWPELSEAGAFHELWLPLQENEVRLCLGFIRADGKRIAGSTTADVTDISTARSLKGAREVESATTARPRGFRPSSAVQAVN